MDKNSKPFEGKTKEPKAAEKIYDLSTGNHEMFVLRRQPDTLEVQQMKVKAGNTKGGSINAPLTSCLTGLDESVLQIKTKNEMSVAIQLIPNQSNRRSTVQ